MISVRNRRCRLSLVVASTIGLLAMMVNPAGAHVVTLPATDYNEGHGSFLATSVLNPNPTVRCGIYSNYQATLDFHDHNQSTETNADVTGARATVNSSSNPLHADYDWGEYWDGTYQSTDCDPSTMDDAHPSGGYAVTGFTGTLTLANGTECALSAGTYQRGHLGAENPSSTEHNYHELNVAFRFSSVSGGEGCPPATSTEQFIIKTTINHSHPDPNPNFEYTTDCNFPIAPQTCGLGHQEGTW